MRKASPRGGREPAVNANDLTRPGRRSDRDKTRTYRTPLEKMPRSLSNKRFSYVERPLEQSSRVIRAHKPKHKGKIVTSPRTVANSITNRLLSDRDTLRLFCLPLFFFILFLYFYFPPSLCFSFSIL